MQRSKNSKEFKELIAKYESITLDDIRDVGVPELPPLSEVANSLTGFGETRTCTLCQAVSICTECVWVLRTGYVCNDAKNYVSYKGIKFAESPKELHEAMANRAKHMRKVFKRKNIW